MPQETRESLTQPEGKLKRAYKLARKLKPKRVEYHARAEGAGKRADRDMKRQLRAGAVRATWEY